ncbi:hypothetical protein [Salinicola sp. CPA57]|uniref:hypothetical protein n=1 Tax=Salinicola sp. CPA57 TaxID=1949080 RepID=UPI000DA1CDBB|nr:hypothetical protein [Salinicola sp. CPA57]
MASKEDLHDWVADAIRAHGGKAKLVQVAKYIWDNYEAELKRSGNLLYTWQYDMRWAANALRNQGVLRSADASPRGLWELK